MTRAYNKTLTPLPADAEGRQIDGRAEGDVDTNYAPVSDAIDKGMLRIVDEPKASSSSTSTKKTTKKTAKKSTDTVDAETDSEEN